ncbi:hypothetical protein Sfulv_54430 [Streptomyces fulvorobeus]|uniref:Uncharacterized protein n=1 Tax=Streptomyces fulvorobeus TaxID=284028 RepID=A0A7J0CDP2_9ACTN|nr:hypothetical protein [Streptomyces fulvorobeus]GFN00633.1 hypothetical protein Sfulv_54430 [Streptomyces fulvorobeus]
MQGRVAEVVGVVEPCVADAEVRDAGGGERGQQFRSDAVHAAGLGRRDREAALPVGHLAQAPHQVVDPLRLGEAPLARLAADGCHHGPAPVQSM